MAAVAEAATAAAVEATLLVRPPERQLSVPAAANKPRFLLSHEAIGRYSAAIASRHKRAVPAVVAVADAAATIAAVVAAVATNLLHTTVQNQKGQSRKRLAFLLVSTLRP
jgi:hypothetical protein